MKLVIIRFSSLFLTTHNFMPSLHISARAMCAIFRQRREQQACVIDFICSLQSTQFFHEHIYFSVHPIYREKLVDPCMHQKLSDHQFTTSPTVLLIVPSLRDKHKEKKTMIQIWFIHPFFFCTFRCKLAAEKMSHGNNHFTSQRRETLHCQKVSWKWRSLSSPLHNSIKIRIRCWAVWGESRHWHCSVKFQVKIPFTGAAVKFFFGVLQFSRWKDYSIQLYIKESPRDFLHDRNGNIDLGSEDSDVVCSSN